MRHFYSLFALLPLLTACSTFSDMSLPFVGDDEEEVQVAENPTAEQLYDSAVAKISEGKYEASIEDLQEIEGLYPFSDLATKAQVMTAYAQYKNEDFDDAVLTIDRFVKLHPADEDITYMYYLRALSFYDRIADVKRDQKITREALAALQEVVRRFPDSEYYKDAKLKLDLVYDHLAGKEMEIGRFYLKSKQYIAAVNRFQTVVDKYQTTSHVAEALYRLVEAYLLLGVQEEAQKNAAVLGHNYPASKWYQYSYRLVKGENSPVPKKSGWFDGLLPFSDDEPTKQQPLPTENEADSWWDNITSVFN